MSKLTAQMIKEKARELGIDDIGIASIDRFDLAPPLLAPKNYFPDAKTVIVTVMRIPRGSYRGIEEGTHWHNYTFYSYNRLNTLFRPKLTYEMATFIEDCGWEAVPCYPGVPERNPMREPVAPGKLPSDIVMNIRLMGVGAGVGEMGHSKVFLSPKFGPRVRLGMILTDAEIEPDPMIEPGTICNQCGRCVRECPGNAIPPINDPEQKIRIQLGGKEISWGDVHMGRCTLTHHGFNNKISPFHKKAFPNMEFDVEHSNVTEEEAYRLCYPMATAKWTNCLYDLEDAHVINYYSYIMKHVGYFAICGAKGCIRACMQNLEQTKRIENTFRNKFKYKPGWTMETRCAEHQGTINPFREEYLDEHYEGIREHEQEQSTWEK